MLPPSLPPLIFAQASPTSPGNSLFDGPGCCAGDVAAYCSDDDVVASAVDRLRDAGFRVLQVSPTTINIAAPALVYEQEFGIRLRAEERPVLKSGREDTATFIESSADAMPGLIPARRSRLARAIEGVAIEDKAYFFELADPPEVDYHHLDVPADVARGLRAEAAHAEGITGAGVHVAMVDSGWYAHPFFARRGVHPREVIAGPGATRPDRDEHGHGTGESANLFAVAPGVELSFVKMRQENKVAAFNAAVERRPRIITNSWGGSRATRESLTAIDLAMEAAVARAAALGITVVFAAGNGDWGFPAQHPDTITAGGVYMEPDGSLRASDYSSGFESRIYPGRVVPDVSGLVGLKPRASYIMLPVPAESVMDATFAGTSFPRTDLTERDDGWAAFSGTSAAAPQIAGACALTYEARPSLGLAELRALLAATARDVAEGSNAFGRAADSGPDAATGAGLLDAGAATAAARGGHRVEVG